MTKAKIAFVAGSYDPKKNGVSAYIQSLRKELKEQEVDSYIMTTHQSAYDKKDGEVKGIIPDWSFRSIIKLAKALKNENFEILHLHYSAECYEFKRSFLLMPLLLKILSFQKPIITTIYDYGNLRLNGYKWVTKIGEKNNLWDRENLFLLTGSDSLIVTNKYAKKLVLERFPKFENHLYEIPITSSILPINIGKESAKEAITEIYNLKPDSKILIYFGFLQEGRGLEMLLKTFSEVLKKNSNIYLFLAGGEKSLSFKGKLKLLIKEQNINHNVIITGFLSNNAASLLLKGADIGVLPLDHGVSLKNSSLHTMLSHGLPIISTHVASNIMDLLNEKITISVESQNEEQLSKAILSLLGDSKLREMYTTKALTFSQKYSWKEIVKQYKDIYQKAAIEEVLNKSEHFIPSVEPIAKIYE